MRISKKKVLVPRLMDKSNFNAQNLNAKELLKRFQSNAICWETVAYGESIKELVGRENIHVAKLLKGRLWYFSMFAFYQRSADAIFYPGKEWFEVASLNMRKRIRKSIPIISTIEGIMGDVSRDKYLTDIFSHPVYTNKVASVRMRNFDEMYKLSTHIISISPFLGKVASILYEKDVTILPLGVDLKIFHSNGRRNNSNRKPVRIVTTGTLYERKRPYFFLKLAEIFSDAEFLWYGDGSLRSELCDYVEKNGIKNVKFMGLKPQIYLANAYRESDLFILTSYSEGVPKVLQEASACGLPVLCYGFYEPPCVIESETGYLVWSDEEFIETLGRCIDNKKELKRMGANGTDIASSWGWESVAAEWEASLTRILSA